MKKQFLLKSMMLLCMLLVGMGAWAADADYTLTPTAGSNNSYTGNCDVTVGSITWNITGNAQQIPWRIGGKSITKVDRTVYSKTAYTSAVSKVDLTVGAASSITVNSLKLVYSTNADFSNSSEISKTFAANSTISFEGNFPANAYYKFVFNVTVSGTSNKFVEFSKVEFYNAGAPDDGGGSTPETPTVTAPVFDVTAGTYTEDQLVLIDNYSSDYLYAYTTDGTTPAFDENLDVTNGTLYDENEGITISSSCTLKVIAVDEEGNASSITSAAYVINKPIVFASLEELVAADLTSGTNVTVSFENVAIKSIYLSSQSKRQGVYFDIQKDGHDIEIYYSSTEVPTEWVVGGTLSGTMTCPWTYYERGTTWELAPASGSWAWTNLTYNAPAVKTITALEVSGTPTKTTYNVGDTFETAGLVVTATYSDDTQAPITTGFDWEIDYGTGNDALVAGATSVDVMVYTDDVMSEVYTVNGLTVTVPVTLTSIAVSGTPTKTKYYVGDTFETAGLVVTGTYSDAHQEVITEGIEWTVDPETLALGTTSVDVIAGVGSVVSEVYTVEGITVAENPYKTATISSFSATSGDINSYISYESFQGDASTAPAINSNNLRLYQNGGYVTVTAVTGLKINSVKITTSATYASTTVGYCVDDEDAPTTGETVAKSSDYTISNLNNNSVSIYCLGTDKNTRLEISAIEVKYSGTAVKELKEIVLSGTYPTEFNKGDEFSHEGMTVTANYTDNSDADVTSSATFTGYDMNTLGEQTVTVSYTEDEITKTAEYTITVSKAPFVPNPAAEGYETVDFAALYSSVTTNATVEDYEGTSFAMAFAKPESSNTPTKYYDNGKAVRAYTGNTVTITGAENITGVNVAWAGTYVDDAAAITGLGTTTAVVTFSKNCRFTAITVYYNNSTITLAATDGTDYYATFSCDKNVVFDDATVYTVSAAGNSLSLNEVASKEVPANTGVLVKTSGTTAAYHYVPSAAAVGENALYPASKDKAELDGYKFYMLAYGDAELTPSTLGFYWGAADGAAFDSREGSAYLALPATSAKGFRFGDTETGIKSIETVAASNAAYNLQGQRVNANQKGIVIVNGKKVLNK